MTSDANASVPPRVGGGHRGSTDRVRRILAIVIGVVWVAWQGYVAATVPFQPIHMRSLHLVFGFAVTVVMIPGYVAKRDSRWGLATDLALLALTVLVFMHLFFNFTAPDFRRVVDPFPMDLTLGVLMIVLVIIGVWRTTGLALVVTVVVAVGYAFLGQHIPGVVGHNGFTFRRIMSTLYLHTDGVLGSIVGAAATLIFPVLVFGAMLLHLGGGDFFTNFAMSCFGRLRGAAAKVAIAASALFATVTGTGAANVATTGVFTIPLMKRTGYRGSHAAAIESSASIGGQILPPVMGASAFVMVEFLQVPYATIVRHALVPGLIFFVAVYLTVHLDAARSGMKPIAASSIPRMNDVLRSGWHFVLPMIALIYLIAVEQRSVARAALYSTVLLIVLDLGRRIVERRPLELRRLVDGCVASAQSGAMVATSVAGIQLLIAVFGLTGLGIKLSSLLLTLAGGSLLALLVLTMLASILLGAGLPTTPTYLILAILTAPALTEFGVPLIAAHLFVFYFGVFGDLTPPTALGPTVGAGIAGSSLVETMLLSMRIGLVGFLLPYMFVYQPALLLIGTPVDIVLAIAIALCGVGLLAVAISGHCFSPTIPVTRSAFLVAAILLVWPDRLMSVIGLLVGGAALVWQYRLKGHGRTLLPTIVPSPGVETGDGEQNLDTHGGAR